MAEDKADEILEEETAKETKKKAKGESEAKEDEAPKKGLSTSLLIKIAVGLGVVLIAMVVSFFLLSSSPETATEVSEEAEVSETASQELNEQTGDDSAAVTPESGTIELPSLVETTAPKETTPASASQSDNTETAAVTPSAQTATTGNAPSDKVLSEMVALQKQLDTMQQENQKLIKRVEQLAKENQTLRSGTPGAISSSASSPINDEQLVSHDEVPLYHRQNRYSNSPQPELKPQWGEFQQAR